MNKPSLETCFKFLDYGFSLVTVGDSKKPNYTWTAQQSVPLTKEQFKKRYEYSGGYIYFSKSQQKDVELPATKGVGIITGYDNIEVIDIDTKVLPTSELKNKKWAELLQMWRDNIDEFDEKFVIYKTISGGYHILYKCQKIEGNKKIAITEYSDQALIETRGIGGYVWIYENKLSKKSYFEIQEISIEDREILFQVCKYFDTPKETIEPPKPKKTNKNNFQSDLTPWDDYNQKHDIWEVIQNDFKIVSTLTDRIVIKRHGAKSAHSGYVYKNSGCMYLFSTGTCYDAEKLITPFAAYAQKYFGGDYTKAGADLYEKGYGSRVIHKPKVIEEKQPIPYKEMEFPLDVFPTEYQNYIHACSSSLNAYVDFMGCGLLWTFSIIFGNAFRVKIKNGWYEGTTLWICLVGRAGIGKTPSINNITKPLVKANTQELKAYQKELERYQEYQDMNKEEKQFLDEPKKPKNKQFIMYDITLESLVDIHQDVKNGIGLLKDELASWFKDMNKYRAGSDLEFWLSTWSGNPAIFNRKTSRNSFVHKPLISVMGGIQPTILTQFFTNEYKESGFLDRVLLCYPDLKVNYWNEQEVEQEMLDWYTDTTISIYKGILAQVVDYDPEDGEIKPRIVHFSLDAKREWERIFNDITKLENSDDENEYIKSVYPKMKSYLGRFCLILNLMHSFMYDTNSLEINKEIVLKAEKLVYYFINQAKKIKFNSDKHREITSILKFTDKLSTREKVALLFEKDPDFNRTEAAQILGITRQGILKHLKTIETEKQ